MSQYRQDPSLIMRSIVHMTDAARAGVMPSAQLTTINQSQLSAQLGLNLGGASMPHTSPSPPASKSATPSPSSSINEEDADEASRVSSLPECVPVQRIWEHPTLMSLNLIHGIAFFSSWIWSSICISDGLIFFFTLFTYFVCNEYSTGNWEIWLLLVVRL